MLIGHRFLDFRNVEEVVGFGRKYLCSNFNPFGGLRKAEITKLNEFLIMRNLLAHYSDYAWRPYHQFMKNKYRYQRVPEPGGFLISITRSGEYRWGEYLRAFLNASQMMVSRIMGKGKGRL
jgi:hypothetical protein